MVDDRAHALAVRADVRETLEVGPLVVDLRTPAGESGRWIREHCESRRVERSPTAAMELSLLLDAHGVQRRVRVARGEVEVGGQRAAALRIAGSWRMTARAVARSAKWTLRPGRWSSSRRQLLVRHAFEHPLMSVLDLRHGFFTLHAAAVARDNVVVLLLGANGAGKTTAALELVDGSGWQLVSDNFVATDGVMAHGFPGAVRPKGVLPHGRGGARPIQQPSHEGGRLGGALLLDDGGRCGLLTAAEAEAELLAYVRREREDHRDSPVFALMGALLETAPSSCEDTVIRRLARIPTASWDWRQLPVASAVELLAL